MSTKNSKVITQNRVIGTITHRGYKLNLNSLSNKEITKIKNDLTAKPEAYIGEEMSYSLYILTNNHIYLPRYYGIMNFSNGDKSQSKNTILPGESVNFDIIFPNFSLKKEQITALKSIIKSFTKYGTCILKLDCGVGKTITSIILAQKIKAKMLVVVHRINLMKQWKDEIEKFTNAKVGIIHRDKCDIDGKDIVITTVLNVINKDNLINEYKKFRLVCLDEAHHLSAREFHKTLKRLSNLYVIGLTATPNKGESTKINHVFKKFIGPIVPKNVSINISPNSNKGNVIINILRYKIENGNKTEHLQIDFVDRPNVSKMLSNISENNERSNVIVNYIVELAKSNILRKILVISDRKYQLRYINSQIKKGKYYDLSGNKIKSGLYTGDQNEDELTKSRNKQIMLGTYPICEEGLNIKGINTLIYATPRRNNEQSVGRALRKLHTIPVIIIDIVDTFSKTFVNQGSARRRYYKSKEYDIISKSINNIKKLPKLKLSF